MNDKLEFNQSGSVELSKSGKKSVTSEFTPKGRFNVEHWRNGEILNVFSVPNGVTNQGKNSILQTYFKSGTQITTWYMLLIDNVSFTALAAGDVYAEIDGLNGWAEFTDYEDPGNGDSALTRPVWDAANAASQAITNANQTIFDIVDSGTVKGLAIVGGGTNPELKGDAAGGGTLWATALFDQGDTAVINGDQLKITYSVST